MAHHVLGDDHIVVDLAIVDLELEAHEVGQDGCGSCLCSDGHNLLSRLWSDDWESGGMGSVRVDSSGTGNGSRRCRDGRFYSRDNMRPC